MKRETMETIDKFIEFMDVVNGDLDIWHPIKRLLLRLPATEETLASGGLVKDDSGKWMKHGDRILADGKPATAWFSSDSLAWTASTDDGETLLLGKKHDEVCRVEKVGD